VLDADPFAGARIRPAGDVAGDEHAGHARLQILVHENTAVHGEAGLLGQLMGFALAEIENLLDLKARRSCRSTRDLAVSKLQSVDARIRELRQLRKQLATLVAECDTNVSDSNCPIIDRLASEELRP
jgi:hypothetical protein